MSTEEENDIDTSQTNISVEKDINNNGKYFMSSLCLSMQVLHQLLFCKNGLKCSTKNEHNFSSIFIMVALSGTILSMNKSFLV